jgi:two-component system response regulator AtoC
VQRTEQDLPRLPDAGLRDELAVADEVPEWTLESSVMRHVREMVDRVAVTDATVLVTGETGVGKEVVVRVLNQQSPRRHRPFVKVNCAALPSGLLESELFGYDRGAFTGADRNRPGKFELAHTGTLFLDEIGELPLAFQAKLLHVLQDRRFSRLGGTHDVRVDVRVVAATNKDLTTLVRTGEFRADLYYRLNVFVITVPPLRERREAIPLLITRFIDEAVEEYRVARPALTDELLTRLVDYHWPGNVRELRNVVRRMTLLGDPERVVLGTVLGSAPSLYGNGSANGNGAAPTNGNGTTSANGTAEASMPGVAVPDPESLDGIGLKELVRRHTRAAELMALKQALERVHWHRLEAARLLHISYKTLLQKMKRHGL